MTHSLLSRSITGRRTGQPVFTRNVAEGIHRLEHAYVNVYLVEDGADITIVDTGFPATWPLVERALAVLGRTTSDVVAIALTHAHFDHLGFAAHASADLGVPIWTHEREEYIARHPYRYDHEKNRFLYPLLHPRSLPILVRMAGAGALSVPGVTGLHRWQPGDTVDIPGRPHVVFSPGHTFGHSALFFPDRDALLTGDALVTLNPYTGSRGPQIVSGAATADSAEALRSLRALADTEAGTVLPGHGEPWRGGIEAAVAMAEDAGPS
ncbi:MBL fold metallo-hydrolase [Planctomonas psychrotolerans]|uniref:MBL fold metallo-hydrolase n=1 Tax=Planctomonas psychrotolerans TaxID=2528712 RepID=UPI001D0D71A9|nr:MBL fold metallo-hydrolase [Planctomonas psychrotolerans]